MSSEPASAADILGYWNGYYGRAAAAFSPRPSQFAAFFAGEIEPGTLVVDIGCGNGRDSLFFAQAGFETIGVDGSSAAVEGCQAAARGAGLARARFLCSRVEDTALGGRVAELAGPAAPRALYARFLLHAITEAQEDALLATAAGLCRAGEILAVEFRTLRDVAQTKVTGAHYRRFIDPLHLIAAASRHGFATRYFVEGFGYAKYKADDAHVARCIFARTSA
jgi:SAM-dependent methyltransferase